MCVCVRVFVVFVCTLDSLKSSSAVLGLESTEDRLILYAGWGNMREEQREQEVEARKEGSRRESNKRCTMRRVKTERV